MKKLTANKLKKMYEAGESQIKIAKKYGISVSSVCSYMKKYGIKSRNLKDANSLRINVTSDQIQDILALYNDGYNRLEIAEKLKITEWTVRKIMRGNCRGTGDTLSLRHKNNSKEISFEQNQLILGTLLGDACIVVMKKRALKPGLEYVTGHCAEQKGYTDYIAKVMNVNVKSYIHGEKSYAPGKTFYTARYNNKYELEKIYNICYSGGKKVVSKDWASLLTEQAIAHWFMDDGCSCFIKNKSNRISTITVRFATLSFNEQECRILMDRLKYFSIDTSLIKSGDGGTKNIICVKSASVDTFMNMVEPYIVDCLKYKIKRKNYEK